MKNINLSLSNVINVTVLGAAQGLGLPNVNTAALFTSESPASPFSGDYKVYKNPSEVLTDFGSGSVAYAQAAAFFAQVPNVLSTGGYLVIIPLESEEDIPTAITRTLSQIYYFGVLVDLDLTSGELATLATYMQTLDKLYFHASATAGDIEVGGPLDLLRSGGFTHTRGLYYTVGAAAARVMAAAYAGRLLSTDFSGTDTTSTMHLKQLATIAADTGIDQTALEKAKAAGSDVYVSIAGLACVYTSGKNTFADEIYNELWFKLALQVAGFNHLKLTGTKIPQTELGVDGLKNAYRSVMAQAVRNGFLAPGSWTSPDTIGKPEDMVRNIADIGYYIYSVPVALQPTADRADRKAPLIQCAVKAAGAVHSSDIIVNVNI